ncbi:MAG: hypothetical protein ACTSU0_06885 [Alphaproteobacteria bacterium]
MVDFLKRKRRQPTADPPAEPPPEPLTLLSYASGEPAVQVSISPDDDQPVVSLLDPAGVIRGVVRVDDDGVNLVGFNESNQVILLYQPVGTEK